MPELSTNNPTLSDWAKTLDPDGQIATIVELLNQDNEQLADMVWVEGNLPTGYRTTVRTGLPVPTWRKLYGGVQPTKTTKAQITDNTGMLEDYGEVDIALADLNGNTAAFRLQEDKGHIEGINQEMSQTSFYGNEGTEPEAFTGFAPRYNDLSAPSAQNIIDAAGTGADNASIWLIGWASDKVHGIFPKGKISGLQVDDKGQVTIENVDGAGGRMEAYRTHYKWEAGLTVRDWRYVVRICNIDRSDLTPDAATGANLPQLMFEAMERIQSLNGVRPAFYMDRSIRTKVRQQLEAGVKSSTLTFADVGGHRAVMFQEVPMRRVDSLAVNEARVV